MNNTYIVYARKSSEADDRQALSIESQLNELKQIVERKQLSVSQTLTEQKSAKSPGRPIFNDMIAQIESGKVDSIIAWSTDRLSRNSVDSGRLIQLFDIGKLKEIITPTQTFTNTPNDKFLLNILWGHAKLENDNKSVSVKRGMKTKAELGWYPFRAVNGYLNTPEKNKGLRIVLKDKLRFPLVRNMWDMLLSGNQTIAQIHEVVTTKWGYTTPTGKKLSRSALYELFKNPFYYGVFKYEGELKRGKHDAMITRDEFDRAQKLISRGDVPRISKHEFAYSNVMKCKFCGFSIVGTRRTKHYKRTEREVEYTYYRCSHMNKQKPCDQPPVKEKELFDQLLALFSEIQVDKDFLDWANTYFQEVYDHEQSHEKLIDMSRSVAVDGIQKKLDNLLDMKLNGELTSEEYAKKKSQLMSEMTALKSISEAKGDSWYVKSKKSFDIAYLASQKFKYSEPCEKKAMIREINSDLSLEHGKITPTLEKPYFLLRSMNRGEIEKKDQFGLVKETYLTPQTMDYAMHNPLKYTCWDEIGTFVASTI